MLLKESSLRSIADINRVRKSVAVERLCRREARSEGDWLEEIREGIVH